MSKLGDVKSMYGQDFGITVTNAPSNIIQSIDEKGFKLPKNMILISSHTVDENDDEMPAIFATDYNGNPLRLTYAIHTINGLYPNEKGELELHIDKKSIKENEDKNLYIDTNNLTYCSFNNLGVTKVSKSLTSRSNSKYPIDTFINVDKNGVLYLGDNFLDYMYEYIKDKIYKNLYPIIMDNIKGWLIDEMSINYYPTDRIIVLPISENGIIIKRQFRLQYKSLSGVPEEINIDINNNDYPIKEVVLLSNSTNVVEDSLSTPEIPLYRHTMDFTITFYPNYNLQNNIFLDNQYYIKIQPQTFNDQQYLMFMFNQNNVFDQNTNNFERPFDILSQDINLNTLQQNQDILFNFKNKYKYFDDANYTLEIYYIKSNNENNTDDAIKIISENVNENISNQLLTIHFSNNGGENNLYQQLKDYLFTVETQKTDVIITKLSDSSNLYKYVLKYEINGERTYLYENIFKVNYLVTNLYVADNYITTINNLKIYEPTNLVEPDIYNMEKYLQFGSEFSTQFPSNTSLDPDHTENDLGLNVVFKQNEIYIVFEEKFISKIFSNLMTITNNGQSKDGFVMSILVNFKSDIYIEGIGGENRDKNEYSIYDADTGVTSEDEAITHNHNPRLTFPSIRENYRFIYPNKDNIVINGKKTLSILTFVDIDELVFQNTVSSDRSHSSNSRQINYGFSIDNAHGPTILFDFTMDYAKFINDNIKIFDYQFGHYTKPILEDSDYQTVPFDVSNNGTENPTLQEIEKETEYHNSLFFVGISTELYSIFNMTDNSFEINASCTYYNNGNITSGTIKARKTTDIAYPYTDGKEYYIYVIEYSKLFYKEDPSTTEGYSYEPILDTFNSNIEIKYKWNYRTKDDNRSNKTNKFNYILGFNIHPSQENLFIDPGLYGSYGSEDFEDNPENE